MLILHFFYALILCTLYGHLTLLTVSYVFYYSNICPFSRKIRFVLDEFNLEYKMIDVKLWRIDSEFLKISPSNETPVLVDKKNDFVVTDSYVIIDYLDYTNSGIFTKNDTFGNDIFEKTEIQRLQMWFDKKFFSDITKIVMDEVFFKTFENNNEVPNSKKIDIIRYNLDLHIKYMERLLSSRKWLACEKFTVSDISAAAHISILDYLGYINWNRYPKLKDWYIVIKSKKGFENMLNERIGAFTPSINYNKYDF